MVHTSPVVLARNKTTYIVLQFAVVAHEILSAVALVAMHMVDAHAPILARPRYTLVNVDIARVPCNTQHTRLRIFIRHSCLLVWY